MKLLRATTGRLLVILGTCLASAKPTNRPPRAPRSLPGDANGGSVRTGLYVDTTTCTGSNLTAVNDAIQGLVSLAQAGRNALSPSLINLPGNPMPYFFGPKPDPKVDQLFADAIAYATSPAPARASPIRITCGDESGTCESTKHTSSPDIGYTVRPNFKTIVLCGFYFHFPALESQPPCQGGLTKTGLTGVGALNMASILLHEFSHAISGGYIQDYALGTGASHQLLVDYETFLPPKGCLACLFISRPRNPVYNADSYALAANWAHGLGLASFNTPQPQDCLDLFNAENLVGVAQFPDDPDWERAYFGHLVPIEAPMSVWETWATEFGDARNY